MGALIEEKKSQERMLKRNDLRREKKSKYGRGDFSSGSDQKVSAASVCSRAEYIK